MKIRHEGLSTHRLKSNPHEKVFANKWRKINEILPGQPAGKLAYLLAYLLAKDPNRPDFVEQDAATIAATVVQWLGSPVGFLFVEECLHECGFDVVLRKGSKR